MKVNNTDYRELHRPCYVVEEERLRNNLKTIHRVAEEADVEIILAFKAYALWRTFPIFREYISATTASSLYEAKLAKEEFGSPAHTFSPAFTDYEADEIARCSSHLSFNSLKQYNSLHEQMKRANPEISFGLRVNPEYSEVGTALYNPCAPGTRFGVVAEDLPKKLPSDIDGFHCHCHCESGSDVFERTLKHIEQKFSTWFSQLKWINFGGGHLMTRDNYDIPLLIKILKDFHSRYPQLHLIMEPGSAFGWRTGPLVAQVVDIVENHGIKTAIVNVSFTCHMPDCLEMPYWPDIRFATHVGTDDKFADLDDCYRIGGGSCLSGDYLGYWQFDHELKPGENIIFEDMNHYTTVKTTMFNGVSHPYIALLHTDGELEVLRRFSYEDYRDRMD